MHWLSWVLSYSLPILSMHCCATLSCRLPLMPYFSYCQTYNALHIYNNCPIEYFFHHEMILVTQLVAAIWKIDIMTSPIKSRAYNSVKYVPQASVPPSKSIKSFLLLHHRSLIHRSCSNGVDYRCVVATQRWRPQLCRRLGHWKHR